MALSTWTPLPESKIVIQVGQGLDKSNETETKSDPVSGLLGTRSLFYDGGGSLGEKMAVGTWPAIGSSLFESSGGQ